MNGRRCPYVEHCPETDEGARVWDHVLTCQSQVRAGFAGVIGFDFPAILEMAEAKGIDPEAIALMLPFADAGLRAGLAKLKTGNKES